MRKLSPGFFILVIIAAIGSVLVAHYEELLPYRWRTYIAPDQSFSIQLPGKPREQTIEVPMEGGGKALLHMVSVRPNDRTSFSCGVTDSQNTGDKTPDQILDSGLEGMLRKIQGTVLSKKRITVQGNPGLEIQASARDNSFVDSRLILAGNRQYMIIAVSSGRYSNVKAVQRIFQSFKLNLLPQSRLSGTTGE